MVLCETVSRDLPSRVHHATGDPAARVVTAVASAEVVGGEPGVGLGLELLVGVEAAPVKGRPPALVEDGLVEVLDDRVVVRRTRRNARSRCPGPPARRGTLEIHSGPLSLRTARTLAP